MAAKTFPKTIRVGLWWTVSAGTILALAAGKGTLVRGSVLLLAFAGSLVTTIVAWEHGWLGRSRPFKSALVFLVILSGMSAFGWWAWPITEEQRLSEKGFEIDNSIPVAGEGDSTDDKGHKTYVADVYVQVSVLNHGEPSIIKKWSGSVRLPDGTMLEGITSGMKNMNVYLNTKNGQVRLPLEPMLFEPWSRKPIPTGERVVGCLVFLFPAGTKAKMSAPGGAFILKIWNVSNRESSIEIPWAPHPPPDGVFMLPGMGEAH